jgi:hypothetical protein
MWYSMVMFCTSEIFWGDGFSLANRYIKWVKDEFPSGGAQSELQPVLELCTRTFQNDERYKSDSRYLRVWVQYVSLLLWISSENNHMWGWLQKLPMSCRSPFEVPVKLVLYPLSMCDEIVLLLSDFQISTDFRGTPYVVSNVASSL